jgi:hypothetical protein
VVGKRADQGCLDHAAFAAGASGSVQHPVDQVECFPGVAVRDEQPGESQLVVLGEVGRFLVRDDRVGPGPVPRLGDPVLGDPHAGDDRGDGPGVGEEARQVERLGPLEHCDGGVELAASAQQRRCRRGPAEPVFQQ